MGFGAYSADYSFFMDGGTESRAWSEERLTANIERIGAFLQQQDADLYLLQEVDRDSTRSYHVDEVAMLTAQLRGWVISGRRTTTRRICSTRWTSPTASPCRAC